jgi:inorganic pyrophosphatase
VRPRSQYLPRTWSWHDVDLDLGERIEHSSRIVVEFPKGSKVKYELDKQTGLLAVDRALASAVHHRLAHHQHAP